jgi:hypothetical protein
MSKHVSGFFGIGKMMKHWNFWNHQRCPCCHHVKEDKQHLMTCPEASCIAKWNESIQGLSEWLQEMDTLPAVRLCLVSALSSRTTSQSFVDVGHADIHSAAAAQDRIGWLNFTEGKISKGWRQLQASYYQQIQSRRTADQWAAGLVTTLLSMVHKQWTHRCNILHARDAQGVRLQEADNLKREIEYEFQLGLDGLLARDHELITRGQERVLMMTGSGQRSWLASIRVARAECESQLAKETASMRDLVPFSQQLMGCTVLAI